MLWCTGRGCLRTGGSRVLGILPAPRPFSGRAVWGWNPSLHILACFSLCLKHLVALKAQSEHKLLVTNFPFLPIKSRQLMEPEGFFMLLPTGIAHKAVLCGSYWPWTGLFAPSWWPAGCTGCCTPSLMLTCWVPGGRMELGGTFRQLLRKHELKEAAFQLSSPTHVCGKTNFYLVLILLLFGLLYRLSSKSDRWCLKVQR